MLPKNCPKCRTGRLYLEKSSQLEEEVCINCGKRINLQLAQTVRPTYYRPERHRGEK